MNIALMHIVLEYVAALFCLFVLFSLSSDFKKGNTLTRPLFILFLVNFTLLVCDALAWGFRGYEGPVGTIMVYASNFMVFACNFCLLSAGYKFTHEYLKKFDGKPLRWLLGVCYIACAIMIIALFISQFSTLFYAFDSHNLYYRADHYLYLVAVPAIFIVIAIVVVAFNVPIVRRTSCLAVLAFWILPLLGVSYQARNYGIAVSNMAITIALFFLFVTYQITQSLEEAERAKRAQHLQTTVLRSQIKPATLYRTLDDIGELIETDKEAAYDALGYFSDYLRGVTDTIMEEDLIDFEDEMKTTTGYLNVRKLHSDMDFDYELDLAERSFAVPALTIQNLVTEVLNGMRDDAQGLKSEEAKQTKERLIIKTSIKGDTDLVDIYREANQDIKLQFCRTDRDHLRYTDIAKQLSDRLSATLLVGEEDGKLRYARIILPLSDDTTQTTSEQAAQA